MDASTDPSRRTPRSPDAPSGRGLGLLVPLAVLIIGAAYTWFAWRDAVRDEHVAIARTLSVRAQQIETALRGRMLAYEALLHAGVGLFDASERVSAEEWRAFVSRLQRATLYPGMQGLGYAERADVDAAEDRDRTAIVFLEPMSARNRAALGFDMMSEPVRREAMELARDTGRASLSGKVTLVQEITEEKQAGFLLYMPVYRNGAELRTPEERRRALAGFVYCPFRAADFLEAVLGSFADDVYLELIDSGDESADVMFASSADVARASPLTHSRALHLMGRSWLLRVRPLPALFNAQKSSEAARIIAIGGGGTLLLAGLAWSLALSRRRLVRQLEAERVLDREIRVLNSTLEQRVARRTAELADANRDLHLANEQLESFAQNVSHDLRAPLRAIDGFVRVALEESARPGDASAPLAEAMRQIRKMQQIIEDLLRLAFIGTQPVQKRVIDLRAMLEATVGELNTQKPPARVNIAPEVREAYADPTLLEHALRNLISNALKFSRKAPQPLMEIGRTNLGDEAAYFVRDNGVGFRGDQADALFRAFHRLHDTGQFEGAGVGLTIVKSVIEKHGGRVWGQSEPGSGATFFFTLPEH